ncbi:MAG: oxidoreductase [Actinobacteria bacterium]|nr:oxidoreductase [Actinomycetota bacterium]
MSVSTSISNKGILIQYDYCTGCHACEVACKKELDLPKGEFGIKVMEYGPAKTRNDRWDNFFLPAITDHCNLCQNRLDAGKLPACVHNCQAKVMEYGDVEELAKKMTYIKKCVLFSPGDKE